MQIGIDLSEFYLSVEWDILEVPATKNEEYYPDTLEPFSGKYSCNNKCCTHIIPEITINRELS